MDDIKEWVSNITEHETDKVNLEFHEIANIFPMMSDDEYAQLKIDIKNSGLLNPIYIYENKIIDGRNRYKACIELKIKPTVKEYVGKDPLGFVVSENLSRRHLTASQKAAVAVEIKRVLAIEAKKRQGTRTDIQEKLPESVIGQSRDQAGKIVGVSGKYVDEAERISIERPEDFEKIKSGEKNISEVLKEERLESNLTESVNGTLKTQISAYGENIYFNSGEAIETRWDDHVIDGDTYPTLTRIGRFFHADGTQFSLREYAQVQDFPDTYKFVGTYSAIKSQIGNAVSPKMAQHIGQKLTGTTFIDLFAGCGGLSCGLSMLQKRPVWANEYQKSYFQTYAVNHPETTCVLKNIFDVTIEEIPDADIVVGGPPCQGFSTAGLRLKNDPRNKLYQQFLRIVDGKRPQEFLMENVPQIAEIKDQIIKDFNEIGYDVWFELIYGPNIGMKQSRKRGFFIGKIR